MLCCMEVKLKDFQLLNASFNHSVLLADPFLLQCFCRFIVVLIVFLSMFLRIYLTLQYS